MTIFDDLAAEQERLEEILLGLDEAQWTSPSAAQGWTIADVVLHLAQSEEGVVATATHQRLRAGLGAVAGDTMDNRAAEAVRMERAAPAEVFARWQRARQAALAAVRAADPDQPLEWVAGPMKPATLATTRLAEHWGARPGHHRAARHRVSRQRTAAARRLASAPHAAVRAEPGRPAAGRGAVRADRLRTALARTGWPKLGTWRFGPPDAESAITGTAGDFCRVAAQRLDPAQSGLRASGPHGATALRVLRTLRGLSSASQPGVDGFGLQGQDGEDAFVDAPEGLAAGDAGQGLQAQGVFAQRQRCLWLSPRWRSRTRLACSV